MRKEDIKSKTRFFVSILVVAAMIFGAFQGAVSAKGDSSQIIDSDTNNGGNEKGDTGIEDLRMDYSFSNPTVREVRHKSPEGTEIWHIVDLQGLPMHSNPGEPILPVKPVNILLPYDRDIEQINVTASEPVVIGTGYNIPIQQDPVKIGGKYSPTKDDKCTKEGSEYDGVEAFPGKLYDVVGVNYFRGFPILTVNLYPVQYVPKTGEIYYYEDIELNVKTNDGNPSPLYRGLENDMLRVKEMVDNPDVVSTYPGPYPHHSYDYVIVTNESLNNTPGPYNWQALLDAKIAKGLGAKKVTVEWINTTFTGVDIQQKIRNFIRYAYENWHTEYVLLGGDSDDPGSDEYGNAVPARDLFFTTFPGDPSQDSDAQNAPSDLYYSCLDGTYNYDGDDKWGEPNDGENGGDVDLIPDVYVGRACVDNATEISNFVEKTLSYTNSADPYLNNVTLFGEYLGFGGVAQYAGNSLDQLINESANHGFYTVGIPNEPPADGRYAVMTMYDRDNGGDDSVTGWMMADRINNGTQLIIHDGHGSEDFVMNMSADHWTYYGARDAFHHMNNTDKYFILYSIACDPGAFDNDGPVHGFKDDCIGEDLTVGSNGYGAVAVILNARYGWGYGNSTDGPGTTFERQFIDAIFGEGKRSLGEALADSKVDNLWRINEDCIRWTYFSENLLGDPELEVKSPEVKGNDAGVKEIKKPGTLVGTGLNTINATIENYGTNDLSSFNVNCSVYRLQKDVLFYDNMESGASKWTVVDNDGDGDSWSIVEPSDPSRYSSATHAFKCTPNAAYQSNADDDLISEAIDCSGYDSVTAEFYLWFSGQYDGWTSAYLDFGEVYLSDDDGATWTLVTTKRCYSSAYGNVSGLMYSFPVEKYVDLTSTVRIKFHWQSDSSTEREGMYVDDVQFYAFKVVNLDYGKDIATSLNSGTLTNMEFTGWNASAGWYAINVSTMLATDEYAANNYQNVTTYAKASKDVGVMMINSPTGLVATGNYTVNATVKNYGFDDQTGVVVQCVIKDSGSTTVFSDTETVDIDSDQTKFVEFDVWNANIEDTYTINVSTSLPGDEGPSNDYEEEVLTVANVPDMAVVSINYPPAGSQLGGYFNINVTIKNNGTVSPDTTLNCTIRDSTNAIVYAEEITGISITPGEYKDFEFPTWDAVDEGTFDINVTTIAAGDVDPTNDYKNITVIIDNIDDVGATAINYPTGIQSTGSHIINATLENFGNINKTNVLVNCSVEQVVSPVTLVSEDFEGYSPMQKIWPPTGWTLVNGTTSYWTYGDTPNSGDYNVEVYGSGGSSVDCWLITNLTHIPATDPKVTFYYRGGYDGYTDYYVAFEVNISTTGTSPSDFAGNQVYDSGLTFSPDYNDAYGKVIVDLSAYAGMDAYIGFHCYYQDSSSYNLQIDDVWTGSLSIVDLLPTESFTPASFPPAGWTKIVEDPSNPNDVTRSSTYAHTGTYSARFSSYSYCSSGNYNQYLITPQMSITSSQHQISFWYRKSSSGSETFSVGVSTTGTDPSDFTWGSDITDASTTWQEHIEDLSTHIGENVYVAIRYTSYYQYYLYIDDFTFPDGTVESFEAVFPPSGWTVDSDWEQGTGHDGGTAYIEEVYGVEQNQWLITPTIDCSGMSDVSLTFWYDFYNSTYSGDSYGEIYVSNDDGTTWNLVDRISPAGTETGTKDLDISSWADGQSQVKVGFRFYSTSGGSDYDNWEIDDVWVGAKSETTTWSEGFEGIIPESGWPPAGWTVEVVSGTDTDNNWTISDGTGTHPSGITPFGDYMAQYNAYSISSGNSARIYSPAVDFSTATNHRLSFYMYHSDDGSWYDDKLVIQVSTDGSTWNNVTSILRYDASNPGWVKHDVDLSAYDGEPVVYIGFLGVSDYGYSIYIDNIEIGYGGVNILFSEEKTFDIPAYSTIYAEFGPWNVATEGNYTIEVTTLMPGDEDNGNNKTTTTVWINDIYDVGAISINYPVHGQTYNTGSYAVNATFENFGNVNLVNVPVNLSVYKQLGGGTPLSEGFESGSIPAGWTVLNEDGDSYQWEAYSTTSAHSGSYVARVHWNSAGNDDWLITPRISIPSGATFTFWAKSYSSSYLEDFEVCLSTTGTDPSDFTTVLDSVTSTPYDWTEYSYDLSAYAGQNVYLAIRCISVNEFYLYIDDVEVSAIGGLDLVYSVDTTLPSLPGGETTYFTFPAWNATEEASYLIKATTLLAGDEDNGNNASAISITINNIKDVGVTDIQAPDVISTEMVCTVNATIESFGNYNLTTPFNVNCSIYDETSMLVFSDEVTIPGIDMGETVYANFAPWSPTAEGNYTINVTTLLAGDEDGSNDAAEKAIIVRDIDDVGVVSINSPVSGGGGGNTYDFESNDGGWIPTADWDPVGDWEWTNSYDVSNYVGSHTPPPSAHSGSGLWGTVLYNDYTNAGGTSYLNMTFDFSGATGANMSFWSWSDIFGYYDYGRVLVNGDELLRIDDYDPTGWEYYTVDLSPYDGLSSVEISFAFYATTVVNYAGWYIDDVTINGGGSGGGSGNLQPGTYTVNATVENYGTVTETFDVNCIITSGGSAGTTSTLLSEGFEDAGCPAGWLNIDGDGDSYTWECDWNYSAHSGSLCAASASYINYVGALTPDNWLITPQIDLTPYASGELSYWVAAQDPDWPADHIEVWVSTTGTNISDFTDQIDDYTETSATWKQRTVDLSAYAGETIYLAFRHCDCTDNYWIKIDDVTVTGSTGGSGGTTVYTSTTTVTALAPGEQIFVEFVPPWAATPGEYTIQVATQLVGDEDTANDQASAGVTVGENQPPKSWHSPSNIESQHPTPGTHVWLYASDNDGFYDDYTLHYIVDNAGERTLTWNSSVSVGKVDLGGFAEGDHTIEYWAEDSAGNTETPHHVVTFYVMLEDKVSQTLRFDGYYGWTFNNWEITQDTLLYFDEDEASELNIVSIWYMIDNTGNWVKYTEPFTVPLGRHSIYFYGIDELGRRTPVARVVVEVLSNEAPTTACILTPSAPDGNNGWYTSDVRIKLAVTDPDGDSTTTKYRIDGGDWKEYTGEITLKESGRHTIQYYSIDSRQGLESVRERSISIDKVAPEITIRQPTGHLYVFGREILPLPRERTVVIGKLNMNAEVTDQNLSGIDSIKIYINGELEDTFTEPQISWTWDEFAIGNREIRVAATDRAGNEAADAIEVIIFNL